jgi:beta-lactamase regulating signal transducer with metallopeptidase domain
MNTHLASLGPALANHLWQSTAFGLLAWLLTLALRRNQARVRYAIWLAASIKFLLPFSLLVTAGNLLPHPRQTVAPAVYSAMDAVEEPFAVPDLPPVNSPVYVPTLRERVKADLPAGLAVLWSIGFCIVLFGWWNRWRTISRGVRRAVPATEGREFEILHRLERGRRPLPLLMSAERMEPGVFGAFRPVLVWPEQLSAHLDGQHVEAIVAHELMHVRRRDNLTALLHMFVEAVFWFHPLVWWMEQQMVKEREQACDESVVAMGGSAETYAESLLKTCWFCIESPLPCMAGVTGADLQRRVADIITGRALLRMTGPKKLLLATVALGVVVTPVMVGQAKAAQRMMLAVVKAAPKPVLRAAHAMIADEQTQSTQLIAEADPRPLGAQSIPITSDSIGLGFDVSTVKPANPNTRSSALNLGNDDIKSNNLPVLFLLQFAYGLNGGSKDQIVGAPSWLSSMRFDIDAKMDEPTAAAISKMTADKRTATLRVMMQTLLANRFHLVVHRETQNLPVLALTVAKGGPKLVSSSASPTPEGEWTGLHNPGAGQMEGRDITLGILASA